MLDAFILTLAAELEIEPPPKADHLNQFVLALNAEIVIVLKEEGEGILLRARIGAMPKEGQEELCMHLMKGNFLGQGTGKSVIGLTEDEKFLTLSLVLPYDMNYKAFKLLLEEFANYLSFWQEELHEKQI